MKEPRLRMQEEQEHCEEGASTIAGIGTEPIAGELYLSTEEGNNFSEEHDVPQILLPVR